MIASSQMQIYKNIVVHTYTQYPCTMSSRLCDDKQTSKIAMLAKGQRVGKRADTISERKRKLRHPYSYRHCKLCTLLHVCKIVCNTQINSVFLLYHALWTGALLIILTHKEHRLMSENWTFLFPKKNPNSRSLPGLITHQWSI